METTTDKLTIFLKTGNAVELAKVERSVNFNLIFAEKTKPFCNVKNESDLLSAITKLTKRFIDVNFAGENSTDTAVQFAIDLLDVRVDWSVLDVVHFFKFVRQRQDLPECKIFGNKISPIKLMELTAVYEEHKAIAREIYLKNETSKSFFGTIESRIEVDKQIGQGEAKPDTRFKELAEELNQKLKLKKDKIYKNANDTKQFLKDLETHWNEQTEKVKRGEITEDEAVTEHHKFRINYK